jgi:hypothetical protein
MPSRAEPQRDAMPSRAEPQRDAPAAKRAGRLAAARSRL